MLLLHTVLAVAYGGLLVSAAPGPWSRSRPAKDVVPDVRAYEYDTEYSSSTNAYDEAEAYEGAREWGARPPQTFMDDARMHGTEADDEFEDAVWEEDAQSVPGPKHGPPRRPWWPPQREPAPPPHHPGDDKEHPHPPHKPHPPHRPHHPPIGNTSNLTIYQILESNPEFSRTFKLVNYTEDITNLLNDSSSNVTFFAVPNWALPKPHHPPHKNLKDVNIDELLTSGSDLTDVLVAAEGLITADKPDEGMIKKFLTYIFLYGTLPEKLDLTALSTNTTWATSLTLPDGSFDGKPLRVRVSLAHVIPLQLSVNLFTKIAVPNLPASNGVVHITTGPVLPPPSIFQISFLFSDAFSIFTSALQRVGLTDEIEWRNQRDGTIQGSPAVTVFAPSNKAFKRLPRKLFLFLFSPFGEHVLKKLLQYHIVPQHIVHSDYLHNASESELVRRQYTDDETSALFAQLAYDVDDLKELLDDDHEYASTPEPPALTPRYKFGKIKAWQSECSSPRCRMYKAYSSADKEDEWEHKHIHVHHYHHLPPPPPGMHPQPPPPPGQDGWKHPMPHFPPPPPPSRSPFPPHEDGPEFDSNFEDDCEDDCKDEDDDEFNFEDMTRFPHPHPNPHPHPAGYARNVSVPTLLANHSLPVRVVQFALPRSPFPVPKLPPTYITTMFVDGLLVVVPDVPARNGALHVVPKLLNPVKPPPKDDDECEDEDEDDYDDNDGEWAGWEEWLLEWAAEN